MAKSAGGSAVAAQRRHNQKAESGIGGGVISAISVISALMEQPEISGGENKQWQRK